MNHLEMIVRSILVGMLVGVFSTIFLSGFGLVVAAAFLGVILAFVKNRNFPQTLLAFLSFILVTNMLMHDLEAMGDASRFAWVEFCIFAFWGFHFGAWAVQFLIPGKGVSPQHRNSP